MEYDRSQLFFILNDISKEKNLTFILKIPTRLTGINPLSWKVPASRSCPVHVRVHTHTHPCTPPPPTHTHSLGLHQDTLRAPGPTVLPVEPR